MTVVKAIVKSGVSSPSFELKGDVLSERQQGRFVVRRYPGWMYGPALAALEKMRLTDKVRIEMHFSQGTLGNFELWIPLTEK